MHFPLYIWLGPLAIHPHPTFEALAYVVGFWLYQRLRRWSGDHLNEAHRWSLIAAGVVGGAAGSKLISWASDPFATWNQVASGDAAALWGGKGIVGGLVGGLIAVEWAKRRLGIGGRTGDLFALPLAAAIAVGRIGCFLTGLDDHTHGLPANQPWAIDFGDGIPRHPTQLYEIAFLVLLGAWLWRLMRRPHREGDVFKSFMVGYCLFRLWLEFIKPGVPLLGLNAIQWLCVGVLLYYVRDLVPLGRYFAPSRPSPPVPVAPA